MSQPNYKWIVWSFDDKEDQTFTDIVVAPTAGKAAAIVAKRRPYATIDRYIMPNRLDKYIQSLQQVLDQPDAEIETGYDDEIGKIYDEEEDEE